LEIKINCSDGYELTGTLYRLGQPVENGTVIICGALGVSRKFYKNFAQFLSRNNFSAITFDYRGTGDSLSYGFDDDTYAPRKAIKKLHQSLKEAAIEERYIRAKKLHPDGIGHFGYFKEACSQSIWEETISWLLKI